MAEILSDNGLTKNQFAFFFRFLKENKCAHEYFKNFFKRHERIEYNELAFRNYFNELSGIIDSSFRWRETIQGHGYWEKIDDYYEGLCSTNTYEKYIELRKLIYLQSKNEKKIN